MKLNGVIPALTTPFRQDESLDLDGFGTLVETVIGDGVDGVVVNGCTGESWAIDDRERGLLFEACAQSAAGRTPVVAGCGAVSTRRAIENVRLAKRTGCDAVMIQAPWYVLPGESDVEAFFRAVLDASELPVMLYNIPRRVGFSLSVALVDRLADHDNAVAIKESSKDWLLLSQIIRGVRGRMDVFAGYASALGLAAITEGAVGYVDSTTPVVGGLSPRFFRACRDGDVATARQIQERLARIDFFSVGAFPATVKAALDLVGRPGGFPRDPIAPVSDKQREKIRDILADAGIDLAGGSRAAAE